MAVAMRGDDGICDSLFSYRALEDRVRAEHPLMPNGTGVYRASPDKLSDLARPLATGAEIR